jgi:hypothetical protein
MIYAGRPAAMTPWHRQVTASGRWPFAATAKGVVAFQSQPQSFCFSEEVGLVQQSRQEIVELLRKAGLSDAADKAMAELPDPVSLEDAEQWGVRHGITRDLLISQFGGSP